MDRVKQQQLIRRLGLPSQTSFKGYILVCPDNNEFLSDHHTNGFVDEWSWSQIPNLAKRYRNLKSIQKTHRLYTKRPTLICFLFETKKKLVTLPLDFQGTVGSLDE